MNAAIHNAIVKHLNATQQLQLAVTEAWTEKQVWDTFGASSVIGRVKTMLCKDEITIEGVPVDEYLNNYGIKKQVEAGNKYEAGNGGRVTEYARIYGEKSVNKGVVAPATTGNTGALYYPTQAPGVLLPPVTPSLLAALTAGGSPALPPNTRLLTQAALLSAVQIAEAAPYPAAAPSLAFTLTDTARKFGLIVLFTQEMLAASNYDGRVQAYVEGQLQAASNNAVDGFLVNLMTSGGTAATATSGDEHAIAVVMQGFAGDLRKAVWIASPSTLVLLQSATNPNIGANGGMYKGLPALPCLAAPENVLFLLDRSRIATYEGATLIESSEEANIVMDSAPGVGGALTEQPTSMYQTNQVALKITTYADAFLLSKPTVITLS